MLKAKQKLQHQRKVVATFRANHRPEPELSTDCALERAVDGLGDPYRQIALLRYYAGRSCAATAEQLGMPLGTVTKHLSQWLRCLLDPDRLLDAQVQSARKNSWPLTMVQEAGQDGQQKILATVKAKAQGDYTND